MTPSEHFPSAWLFCVDLSFQSGEMHRWINSLSLSPSLSLCLSVCLSLGLSNGRFSVPRGVRCMFLEKRTATHRSAHIGKKDGLSIALLSCAGGRGQDDTFMRAWLGWPGQCMNDRKMTSHGWIDRWMDVALCWCVRACVRACVRPSSPSCNDLHFLSAPQYPSLHKKHCRDTGMFLHACQHAGMCMTCFKKTVFGAKLFIKERD
mmetsp:Transcript_14687/g.29669  ORF Transcript_14687/g.29669 Transcript_14687/m.29669 type:complete len:205 (-) Transcript_14687:558-1172(-)